ncbi:MAG: hypothetical protein IPK00_15140 [Deltaproteobacteria bacterium]|nr:hypothetical protein [Deltaproteobacteria bacterium]
MSNRIRRSVAALTAALLLTTVATTPSFAQTRAQGDAANASPVLDVMLLRPVGFISLVVGVGLMAALTPIVLITRPHEINKPFEQLVVKPARFLWVDPIGGH